MATDVTEATWTEEVEQADKPVIVDFWADWCGPCHAVAPVLDRIADEHGVKIVKVNIDQELGLAQKYGVSSIPLMILFRDGQQAGSALGAQPKTMLERSLGLVEAA
jgi:thioredoxin 1